MKTSKDRVRFSCLRACAKLPMLLESFARRSKYTFLFQKRAAPDRVNSSDRAVFLQLRALAPNYRRQRSSEFVRRPNLLKPFRVPDPKCSVFVKVRSALLHLPRSWENHLSELD